MSKNIVAITVTYYPDIELILKQKESLQAFYWVVVDNNSDDKLFLQLEEICKSENIFLIKNIKNEGLAKAINIGVRYAVEKIENIEFLLLLDQDSGFDKDDIWELYNSFLNLEALNLRVGCVGPNLIDVKTKKQYGFHYMKHGLWRKKFSITGEEVIACTNINGSGTFMRVDLFLNLNGLKEDLFIDHVDTEWSFRILNAGYYLYGIPKATFDHQMGESSFQFWFLRWRVWPLRSPLRHYFLFRNTIKLIKIEYIPFTWKFWAIIKLLITFILYLIYSNSRKEQVKMMLLGLKNGDLPKV